MTNHHSLVAYHTRKRVEAELELERLRRSEPVVHRVPVHISEPCSRPHIGLGTGLLIGLGALVVIGALLSDE